MTLAAPMVVDKQRALEQEEKRLIEAASVQPPDAFAMAVKLPSIRPAAKTQLSELSFKDPILFRIGSLHRRWRHCYSLFGVNWFEIVQKEIHLHSRVLLLHDNTDPLKNPSSNSKRAKEPEPRPSLA